MSKRIAGAAYNVARQYGVDPADVEQEIVLAILDEYSKNPAFLDQADAYIVNKGAWMARNVLKRQAVQMWNHEAEEPDDEREYNGHIFNGVNDLTFLDVVSGRDSQEAVDLAVALKTAYSKLDSTNQTILSGMYEGLTRREIGQAVGMTHAGINWRIPKLAEVIQAQL